MTAAMRALLAAIPLLGAVPAGIAFVTGPRRRLIARREAYSQGRASAAELRAAARRCAFWCGILVGTWWMQLMLALAIMKGLAISTGRFVGIAALTGVPIGLAAWLLVTILLDMMRPAPRRSPPPRGSPRSEMEDVPCRVGASLVGGRFAIAHRAEYRGCAAFLKLARDAPIAEDSTAWTRTWVSGFQFHTGSVGDWTPEPDQVLAAEASALGRIDHPAFPRLLATGRGRYAGSVRRYMITEWIDGESWRTILDRGSRIPLSSLVVLVRALADVRESRMLAFHGDLKPGNLFLDRNGQVRVVGPTSEIWDNDHRLLTSTYNPFLDASDEPALGLVIIEVLTGRHPLSMRDVEVPTRRFGPRLEERLRLYWSVGLRKVVHLAYPTEIDPSLSPAVERVALRCLGLERTDGETLECCDGFASVAELADALAACDESRLRFEPTPDPQDATFFVSCAWLPTAGEAVLAGNTDRPLLVDGRPVLVDARWLHEQVRGKLPSHRSERLRILLSANIRLVPAEDRATSGAPGARWWKVQVEALYDIRVVAARPLVV